MDEATCDHLFGLAMRYAPSLRFHELERFFPLLAESWLSMTSGAPWPDTVEATADHSDVPLDLNRRGASLSRSDPALFFVNTVAGRPVGGDRPLQLSDDPADPYAIGRDELHRSDDDWFINVGGWPVDGGRRYGDLDYLAQICSEIAAAIGQQMPWLPMTDIATRPHPWIPQPTTPTTYCEVTWAGDHAETSSAPGLGDLAPGDSSLRQWLGLTFHYLYGAREPAADQAGPLAFEGQWESVTLWFAAETRGERDEGRPPLIADEPSWVVASQGRRGDDESVMSEARRWDQVHRVDGSMSPVIYVALGTHRNFFEPQPGSVWDPSRPTTPADDPRTWDTDDPSWAGVDGLLGTASVVTGIAALVAAACVASVTGVGLIACVAAAVAAALFFLIWWLISLFKELDNEDSGESMPGGPFPEHAPSTGPQAGAPNDPAAPPEPDSEGSTTEPSVGLPNSGSLTGANTSAFDIRLVNHLPEAWADHDHRPTGYPSDRRCEEPVWWSYTGRWGTKVGLSMAPTWRDGSHLVDRRGRGHAYWAAYRLQQVLHGGPAGP